MSSLADIMNTGGGTRKRTRITTPQKPQSTPPQFDAGGASEQPQQPTQTAQAPQTPQVQGVQPAITAPEPPSISSWLKKEVPPTAEEAQQTAEQTEETPRRMSLEEIANHLYATNKPSPEEEEKQRKRERSKAILAAIGDGVSALSNLYHTSKYAPDMSNPGSSLSDNGRKRYDRWKQVRKDNEEKYNNAILRARQGDYELNLKEREMLRKEAADAAKDAREAKRLEEQTKFKMEELNIRRQQAKTAADKAAADAEYKKAQQEFNQRKFETETALKKEQIANQRATLAETARYHSAQIALGRERNNISRSKGRGKNGGSTDASDMYYISGKHFGVGRKKQLSKMEENAIYQYAVNVGWVDKKNQNAVKNGTLKKGDIIAKLANYTPQAKQFLIDNYGYTDTGSGKSLGLKHNKGGKKLGLK
ncbi:hypothetical protein [Prevotella nigrescens]|uniref:hypothetical protein n=1 Tax=Prevotella nigrescens TaxID=28133 RepID=UPI002880B7D7|nr:hypothetical protein [Prevotella nigrescens]